MAAVLHRFRPYHQLLGSENGAWYKTGTMSDIQSMAGYFSGKDGRLLVFVIMLEGSGAKSGVRRRILELLKENLG
jgi:D-alanyl-D-alanine carboxypeptidase